MSPTFTPVNNTPVHKNGTAPKTPTKKTNVAMEAKILQAKKDVEGRLETEKWRLIAEEVGKAGGGTYPGESLRKYVREMEKGMKGGAAAVAAAAANGGGDHGDDEGEEDVDDDDVKMEIEED
ncbi:hypothetical protein RIB2604_00601780 [Aspergillus luchuensis]|uniref:Uncharacterized protein n=1 Tax=Aspergillus kawachii TaxID=1069201 RepID=A0A146F039_ASPKA|nr:hypothetical protein RIB2604_00601780 [Aspergillus luchuensis]